MLCVRWTQAAGEASREEAHCKQARVSMAASVNEAAEVETRHRWEAPQKVQPWNSEANESNNPGLFLCYVADGSAFNLLPQSLHCLYSQTASKEPAERFAVCENCAVSPPATIRMIRNIRISGRHTQLLRQARCPRLGYHTHSPMAERSSSGCCRTRPPADSSGAAAASARSRPVDSLAQHHIQRTESVSVYAHAEGSAVARAAEDMPSLMHYHPTPWLPGRHAQTVFASNRPLPQPGLQLQQNLCSYKLKYCGL